TANAFTPPAGGYSFKEWTTEVGGGGDAYADGAEYAFDDDVTLYAQWEALSCAAGGVCVLGDTGPGGGKVFYVADGQQAWGTYMEAAPNTWSGGSVDPLKYWAFSSGNNTCRNTSISTSTEIGTGKANTNAITTDPVCNTASKAPAAWAAQNYRGGGKSDWFLPSKNELNELRVRKDIVDGFTNAWYWSSSQSSNAKDAWFQVFPGGTQAINSKYSSLRVRPVRAFSPLVTVIFDSNGGSGTMADQTTNVPTALTANAFTRAGYSFTGWTTEVGGGGDAYADGAEYAFDAYVTLYAQWLALPNMTVTFNANDGSGATAAQLANVATALTVNAFTRAGYSFTGWNTEANGSGGTPYADGAEYAFDVDVTLYAQWEALPMYTVTFHPNGGTGSMSTQTTPAAHDNASHCAYNVTSSSNAYSAPSAYASPPPPTSVVHPVKLYPPSRMNVLAVNAVGTFVVCVLIDPVPPLGWNVTVYIGNASHCAYNVTSTSNAYSAPSAYGVPP
ncbi:MAG: InlB B-repeat-containing protein, partial [Candidatus Nanopelagicales bacterium]|nr:InlB B-repeat-containing protein [Candidatus Nanopelagicales bacterium]